MSLGITRIRSLVSAALLFALVSATAARQNAPLVSALRNNLESVKFAVIGDTGTGSGTQYAVGKQLAGARARFPFEFVIMLGDNLYGGESAGDYTRKFERPYQPLLRAGVSFYASLGNHDDREVLARLFSFVDLGAYFFIVKWDFRNQNHIGAAGQP